MYVFLFGNFLLPLLVKFLTNLFAPHKIESKSWLAEAYACPVFVRCAAVASPSDAASMYGMPKYVRSCFDSFTMPSFILVVCCAYFLASSIFPSTIAFSYLIVASFLICFLRSISAVFSEGGLPSKT